MLPEGNIPRSFVINVRVFARGKGNCERLTVVMMRMRVEMVEIAMIRL